MCGCQTEQVPLESIQEFGIVGLIRTTNKGVKLPQGTPSKPWGYKRMIHEIESGEIELEQCPHAATSAILESHLAFSWPALLFRGNRRDMGMCSRACPMLPSI